ncbi:MAG: 2,3-bisphosphoglycerate-independent phosphoglycerate mutase [Candidatus Yanofskybacteria bacterium]|nr:2,3-bisphosphoglycerate-independent phosphoglycerate mutase [Candidatus Yanofskybacteria bacterium]
MRPVVLTILDGWGYSAQKIGNAISDARTPNMDFIVANYPSLLLQASGKAVGMTWGEAGNSEVGHLTLGAGRSVFQYLSRINKAVENGEFFTNPALKQAVDTVQKNQSKLHLAGLLTSGSVHAYFNHIIALIKLAQDNNVAQIKLHLFMDGKDSGLKEGKALLTKLQEYIKDTPSVKIATIIGRDYSMDRNNNWNLTEKAYNLMVKGDGEKTDDPLKKLGDYYGEGLTDGKIPPLVIEPSGIITPGDAVVFFNFREDSMRQLTRSFVEENIEYFARYKIDDLLVVGLTEYIIHPRFLVAFPIPTVNNGLAEFLSINGKTQLHIAETEKYAHVTYFFNALKSQTFAGETDIFIKSTKKPELEPEMMANEILAKVVEELQRDFYDFMVVNFANADMLAHSGNLEKTTRGIETVDTCIGKLREAVFAKDGILIITADHGNAESLSYSGGEAETRHNLSPVPFHIVVKEYERPRSPEEVQQSFSSISGLIADVAPTILEIMGLPKPEEMTGESLFRVLK